MVINPFNLPSGGTISLQRRQAVVTCNKKIGALQKYYIYISFLNELIDRLMVSNSHRAWITATPETSQVCCRTLGDGEGMGLGYGSPLSLISR